MRKLLRKIVEILDGTPSVYGKKKQRGQSLVEMALVSPLLVIMLAGMVEIGWFARNYLILLEVTRVGARTGTVQQNELGPRAWREAGSIVPADGSVSKEELDAFLFEFRRCDVDTPGVYIGFYNFLSCVMIRSLDPLPFGRAERIAQGAAMDDTFPDDIVISAFAVQAVDPHDDIWGGGLDEVDPSDVRYWPLGDDGGPQALVVGRWPTNANECHYDINNNALPASGGGIEERDPFDWITEGGWTVHPANEEIPPADREVRHYLEVGELDATTPERQRGFAWFGAHPIAGTGCFGSEWGIRDVEDLINLQGFNLSTERRRYVPSQGIVLVEMWWKHETLSQFLGLSPVISPVFAILGTDTVVEVWAAFPLPQVEPRIEFSQ
ncbi:MAG: hypothetical protein CL610_19155 [Anaerolineaceae bacterium]|nr:hypothetical protein [Anaerolineaceae bacterium]